MLIHDMIFPARLNLKCRLPPASAPSDQSTITARPKQLPLFIGPE
jgi:hypothetical protein